MTSLDSLSLARYHGEEFLDETAKLTGRDEKQRVWDALRRSRAVVMELVTALNPKPAPGPAPSETRPITFSDDLKAVRNEIFSAPTEDPWLAHGDALRGRHGPANGRRALRDDPENGAGSGPASPAVANGPYAGLWPQSGGLAIRPGSCEHDQSLRSGDTMSHGRGVKRDEDGNAFVEHIQGWTKLTGKCSECGSSEVVIRINSCRRYLSAKIMAGDRMDDYCAAHVPPWVAADVANWMKVLQTPPGG